MADQGSEGLLSPFLRARRLAAVRPYLQGRVLDVGCGVGELAAEIPCGLYLGVDVDEESLSMARNSHPTHQFQSELPQEHSGFDTVVCLAVIEHISDQHAFLVELVKQLVGSEKSRIVLTTPHPVFDWVHEMGAAIGLFSKHAAQEHEDLLDRKKLELAGTKAGLKLAKYRRFLFGGNQIAIYKRAW